MNTLFLRFPDGPAAASALDGMTERGVTVDVIGAIPTKSGWHVNLRCECAADRECLSAYVVTPAAPFRVFA